MNLNSKGFIKIILSTILLIFIVFTMIWLWQRQPKPKQAQETESPKITKENQNKPKENTVQFTPANFSIFNSNQIKLETKLSANSGIVIVSNNFAQITKSDNQGNVSQNITLEDGLNLISVYEISNEPKITNSYNLVYFTDKVTKVENIIKIGSVKNIFENVITISYENKDQNIKIQPNTQIIIPLDKAEATGSPINAIRIGDFALAATNSDNKNLIAQKLEIIRENKPRLNKQIILAKTLSKIKQNIISAKDINNPDVIEFTIDKNSKIQNFEKLLNNSEIQKGQNVIIIYEKRNNKNIISLLNTLP